MRQFRSTISDGTSDRRRIAIGVAAIVCLGLLLVGCTGGGAGGDGDGGSASEKILFHTNRDGNFEIYSMNPDGSGMTNLTEDSGQDAYPAWSPDRSKVAFASNRRLGGDSYEIWVMNADGSNQTRLTTNDASGSGDFLPDWKPDGTEILFHRGDLEFESDLYKMNSDGSNIQQLTTRPLVLDAFGSWSPDGTRIAFHSTQDGNKIGSNEWDQWEIYTMDADGGNETRVTNTSALESGPDWTDAGIVFAATPDNGSPNDIYKMNADGSGRTKLTTASTNDILPSWSPGGSQVAFQRGGQIFTMSSDGSGQEQITESSAFDQVPDW